MRITAATLTALLSVSASGIMAYAEAVVENDRGLESDPASAAPNHQSPFRTAR